MAKKKKKKEQTLRDWLSSAATKGSNFEQTVAKHKAQSADTRRKKEAEKNKVTQKLKKAGVKVNAGAGINQASDKVRKQSTTGSYNRNIKKTKPITQIRVRDRSEQNKKVQTLLSNTAKENQQKQNNAIRNNPLVNNTAGAGVNQSGTKTMENITANYKKNSERAKKEIESKNAQKKADEKKDVSGKKAVNFVNEFNEKNEKKIAPQTKKLNINNNTDGLEDVSQPDLMKVENIKQGKQYRQNETRYQTDKQRQKAINLKIKGAGGITDAEANDYNKRSQAFQKRMALIESGKYKIKSKKEYDSLIREQNYLQKKYKELEKRQKKFDKLVKQGKSIKTSGGAAGAYYDKTNVAKAVLGSDAGEKYKYLGKDAINTAYAIQAKYGNDAAKEYLKGMSQKANEAQGLAEYQQFERDVQNKGTIAKGLAYSGRALKGGLTSAGEGFVQGASSAGGNKNRIDTSASTTTANLITQNLNGYVDKKGNLIKYEYDKNGNMTAESQKKWEKHKNTAGAFAFEAMQSVGNQIPSLALGYVTGFGGAMLGKVVGLGTMGIQAYGSQYAQDLQEGRTPEEADRHATFSGISEIATETMLGGIPILGNADSKLTNIAMNGVSRLSSTLANNKVVRELFKGAVGEGIEEYVQAAILDPAIERFTLGDYSTDYFNSEAVHNAAIGAFVGFALSPGQAVDIARNRKAMGINLEKTVEESNKKGSNETLDRMLETANKYNGFENLADLTTNLAKSDPTGKTSGIGAIESVMNVEPGTMENLYSEQELKEKFGETNAKQYLEELESYKNKNGLVENVRDKFSDFRKGIEQVRQNYEGVEHYSDKAGKNLESITRNENETDSKRAIQLREQAFNDVSSADPNIQNYIQDIQNGNTQESYRVANTSKYARYDIERLTGKDEKLLNKYNQAIEFSIKPLTVKKLLLAGMSREELSRISFITNRYDSISKTGKEFGKQKLTISKKIGNNTYEMDIVPDNSFGSAGVDIVDFRKVNAQSRFNEAYEKQVVRSNINGENQYAENYSEEAETPREKEMRERLEATENKLDKVIEKYEKDTGEKIEFEEVEEDSAKYSVNNNGSWQQRTVEENGETYLESKYSDKRYRIPKQEEIDISVENGVVSINTDYLDSIDKREYRDFIKAYNKKNLIAEYKNYKIVNGKEIHNKDTNKTIAITSKGINDFAKKLRTFNSLKSIDNLRSLFALNKIIEESIYRESSDDEKGRPHIYDYYNSHVVINGTAYVIDLCVVKTGLDADHYHYHSLTIKKENSPTHPIVNNDLVSAKKAKVSSNLNISQAEQKSRKTSSVIKKSLGNNIVDNNNNKLSKTQIDFFKDSKVRDENGNLMVMYHGTPAADFTKFRSGSYFTANEAYANRYQNPSASSISTGKQQTNPNTYRVYLNITKPFDINDAKARDIYVNEYIKGGNAMGINPYESDAFYDSIDSIDWTEAEDLKDFLEEEGYDYDGIVLDEGADGGYGQDVQYRGKSYMIFNPEQVKNVDNKQPTENEDIRFSLKEPVENGRSLIAVHNLYPDKLIEQIKLGGVIDPSIAVIPGEIGHTNFGNVSVLFGKRTIDPKADPRNAVYSRDAWTETFPNNDIEYKIDTDKAYAFNRLLRETPESKNLAIKADLVDYVERNGEEELINYLRDNYVAKAAFIKDTGISDEDLRVFEDEDRPTVTPMQRIKAEVYKNSGLLDVSPYNNPNYEKECLIKIRDYLLKFREQHHILGSQRSNILKRTNAALKLYELDNEDSLFAKNMQVHRFVNTLKLGYQAVQEETVVPQKIFNTEKTQKKIDSLVNQEEFEKWLKDKTEGIVEKKGIRTGEDPFYSDGTSKSWEQTHLDYTPENIVKVMTQAWEEDRENPHEVFHGFQLSAIRQFNSIEEIKKYEDYLEELPEESYEDLLSDYETEYDDLVDELESEIEDEVDYAWDLVRDIANRYSSAEEMQEAFENEGLEVDTDILYQLEDLKWQLAVITTKFFEAKPRRVVGLNEIEHVLIPSDINPSVKTELTNLLEENNISYEEYNGDEDRVEKANKLDSIKFKRDKGAIITSKDLINKSEELTDEVAKRHNINDLTNKIIQNISRSTGVPVRILSGVTRNIEGAFYKGDIYLNDKNGEQVKTVFKHELTHYLKSQNEDLYQELEDAVYDHIRSNPEFQAREEEISRRYREAMPDMSDADIREEVVADYVGNILFQGDTEQLRRLTRSNIRILDAIKEFFEKIKTALANTLPNKEKADILKAEKAFMKLYDEVARENRVKPLLDYSKQQKYHISSNARSDVHLLIDSIRNNHNLTSFQRRIRLRDFTPRVLTTAGIPDLRMEMSASHIVENILSESEARQFGVYRRRANYHNLGENIFARAIDNMDDPIAVIKSRGQMGNNNWIVITDVVDRNNNIIIVPFQINQYVDSRGDRINRIKSVYGKINAGNLFNLTLREDPDKIVYVTTNQNKSQILSAQGVQFPNRGYNPNSFYNLSLSNNYGKSIDNGKENPKMSIVDMTNKAKEKTGSSDTTFYSPNESVTFNYKLVDANTLIASNDEDGNINPDYPSELQPRDRSRMSSWNQIRSIAASLNPALLEANTTAQNGAPIIGSDNVVESGNGRAIALQMARRQNSPAYKAYLEYLRDNAEKFGFKPEDIKDGVVLVRERTSDVDRLDFVRKANESTVATMSATERARVDSERITPELMDLFEVNDNGEIQTFENTDFIRSFLETVVPESEQGDFMTSDGHLTQNGINRIRNAIFAKAYNADENLLVRLTETTDNDAKNVTTGLLKAAPRVSQVANLIQQGELYDLNFSNDLAQGANLFMNLKSQDITVDMFIDQANMFDDGISPAAKAMAYVFETYKNSPNRINEYINNMCATIQSLGSPNQMTMFDMDRSDFTKGDVIKYADERTNRETELDSEGRQSIEARLRYDKSREAQADSGSLRTESNEPGINEQLLADIIQKSNLGKKTKKAKQISLTNEAPDNQSASSVSRKRTAKKTAKPKEIEKPRGLQYEGQTLEEAMKSRPSRGEQVSMLDKSVERITDPNSEESLEVLGAKALQEYLTERMKEFDGKGINQMSSTYSQADKIRQGLINEGHAFDKLAEETGNRNIKNFRNNILHTQKKAQLWIGKHQTDLQGNIVGESLGEILKPIDNLEDFSQYLRTRLNFDRWKTDKPLDSNITQSDTLDLIEQYHDEHPEYEEQAKKIYKYIDNINQYMIDSGLVEQDTINMLKDLYPNYVPIRKPAKEFDLKHTGINQSSYVIGNMIKKAKGGGSLENWETIDKTLVAITNAVTRKAEVNRLLNEVYSEWNKGNTRKVDVREIDGKGLEELGEQYQELLSIENGKEVAFYREGKKYIMGMDSMLIESLDAINNSVHDSFMDNLLTKNLAKGMDFFKKSVTEWNPGFIVRNAFKDFGDALINAPEFLPFVTHYFPAMKQAFKGVFRDSSDIWRLYEAQGALNANYWSDEGIEYDREGILASCWNPLVLVEKLNLMIEQTPRLAEFMNVIEREGVNESSLSEALYRSDDITVNFSRGTKFTRTANRYFIPFFNPTVQGFSKAYRNFAGRRGFRTMLMYFTRLAAIGIGTKYANDLLQKIFQRFGTDDDKKKKWKKAYEENVTDYMKTANYIIPNFFSDKGDTFIRLPKGRMQGGFGMITNDMYRKFALGEEDIDLGESWVYLLEQINPVSMSTLSGGIAAPIVQASNNKNYFGGDIVSSSLSKLPAEMQYDENTDNISILLGKTLKVSPKKINYVLDQYSGVIGDTVLPFFTQSGLVSLDEGEKKDAIKMVGYNLLGKQFVNDTAYSNQVASDYSDLSDRIEEEKYQEYQKGNNKMTPAKAKSWYIEAANSDITKLYGQKDAVYEDNSLSNAQKREKLREIQKEINLKKKSVVDNMDTVEKGLQKVYKKNGKVYSTDLAKILVKKVGTETANKQAINVLYYDNDNLKDQAAYMKKAGISYRKQAEFFIYSKTAGYSKTTGYGRGKTTKKQKLVNRLNKMNLSKAEKILMMYSTPMGFGSYTYDLTRGEFGSTDNMRNAVVRYLNKKKKLTTKERLAILENAGYTIGKDKKGYYVSW